MFNTEWECQYFFAQNVAYRAQCLICDRQVSHMRKYNIQRHYKTVHSNYEQYTGEARISLLAKLKIDFEQKMLEYVEEHLNQKTPAVISPMGKLLEAKIKRKVTYFIALVSAKHCRPFGDGIVSKDLSKSVFECLGEKGQGYVNALDGMAISRATISRRTETLSTFIFSKVKDRILQSKYFSLCLDQSTHIKDANQLIICINTVDKDFNSYDDFLSLEALQRPVNGESIYEALSKNLFSFADKSKLSLICTDGAPVMIDKNDGLAGCLYKNNLDIPMLNCIIHEEAIFANIFSMVETMKIAIRIVKRIIGAHNTATNPDLVVFLEELQSDFGDFLNFKEVSWLSCERTLQQLYNLQTEIQALLELDDSLPAKRLVQFLKDPDFLLDLAFLCDMSQFINQLNTSLQGKNKRIFQLIAVVDEFKRRLIMLQTQFWQNNLSNLPRTAEIFETFANYERLIPYNEVFTTIIEEYNQRFADMNRIKYQIQLFDNPLVCEIEKQSPEIQTELIKMQNDLFLPIETGLDFWQNIDASIYPNIIESVYKLYSMFGSTNACESVYSSMKVTKTRSRNNLTDKHLDDLLRIKCNNHEISIDDLVNAEFAEAESQLSK